MQSSSVVDAMVHFFTSDIHGANPNIHTLYKKPALDGHSAAHSSIATQRNTQTMFQRVVRLHSSLLKHHTTRSDGAQIPDHHDARCFSMHFCRSIENILKLLWLFLSALSQNAAAHTIESAFHPHTLRLSSTWSAGDYNHNPPTLTNLATHQITFSSGAAACSNLAARCDCVDGVRISMILQESVP